MRLAVLLLLALTGCSSILPERSPAPDLYQLGVVTLPAQKKPVAAQILVEPPLAARGLDSDRIVVRSDPYEVKYLAGVRWTDRVPRLIQSALVQGLESANAFAGVGRPEEGLRSSYTLMSDLRAFDILSAGLMGSTKVQIVLAVKLVRAPGGEVIAQRLVAKEADAKSSGNADVVAAFDGAMKDVAAETMAFVVAHAGPAPKSVGVPSAAVDPGPNTATP